ncbi:MAG: hypothetical protein A3I11_08620 [Elusimicrobia bacterium RIFCSPLOWO2_02_FULL_39_32]|nr:MAG: hypothetical protein A3B80_03510 [Elusimicrobia bacterium RIFCSPHIGHO2_02_FULL_39_36]OGR93070.1 MAG: hypothetical protein A3I11_08620 [Elusimicrobia bacterium RIFCSPLOWO2_02_FULL_39_32]OGS00353.1 MAG: hypothetical protein A3G85_00015 [Elusimicrobia bacterium RIFCSPLOWO2_12_FULL_39_28]
MVWEIKLRCDIKKGGTKTMSTRNKSSTLRKTWVLGLFLAVLTTLGIGLNQKAEAVVSDTTTITVTIAGSLSVSVGSATYGLGTKTLNETYISTAGIPVTNNSASLTADWQIRGSSSASWNPHASTNTGTNNFNLRVLISTAGSGTLNNSNFSMSNTGLLDGVGNNTNLTNMNFGFGSNGHGDDIAINTTRYLWFRFIAPAAISAGAGTAQNISLIVTAADSSTYANE